MSEQTRCQKLFFVLSFVMYASTRSQKLNCSSSAIELPSVSGVGDSGGGGKSGELGLVEEILMESGHSEPHILNYQA
jgi:hypothetical protein